MNALRASPLAKPARRAAYLTDVMPRLADREAGADVTDLLPRQWKVARLEK